MRGLDEKDFREKDSFLGKPSHRRMPSSGVTNAFSKIDNSPGLSITAYCLSSISMTVVNKYVVSGSYWNLNFFYLAIQVSLPLSPSSVPGVRSLAPPTRAKTFVLWQSIVCVGVIAICKQMGLIKNLAPFDTGKARRCPSPP